jgi:hypothetical protein
MEMERKKALKAALRRAKMKKLNNIDEEKQDEPVSNNQSLYFIVDQKIHLKYSRPR